MGISAAWQSARIQRGGLTGQKSWFAGSVVAGFLLIGAPAFAQGALSSSTDCGGDAFSSAQVIEKRPPRRGPIIATPDTLCADLAPQQPPARVDIYANPIILPENGTGRGPAPYGGWPRRSGPPGSSRP